MACLALCVSNRCYGLSDSIPDFSAKLIEPIIHPSARPEDRRQAMIGDLASNRLPPAFLYESSAQSKRWLAVHEAYSPFVKDPDCRKIYEWIAGQIGVRVQGAGVHVIGLGCGSGVKDFMLLRQLEKPIYWPVDISQELVLEAVGNSPASRNHPLVLDLARAKDIGNFINNQIPIGSRRIYTLFGILPNFNPQMLSELLLDILQSDDLLLLSANLAPGNNYVKAVDRIMAQYENSITCEWLLGALGEINTPLSEGRLVFRQRKISGGLRKIEAQWYFEHPYTFEFGGHHFTFKSADKLEVFYSIRHTVQKVREWIESLGLTPLKYRLSDLGEEAVFLCQVS